MLDRITGLQVFSRLAALGSLSGAARALGMSQTMATKHMAALEDRLGTKLVHRTTRKMTLTEAGRDYLESAERILADFEEAEARVASDAIEVRGTLRLNAPVSFGIRELAPLLPEFSRLYPDLKVDLGLNDRYVDLIDEGWDLVIRIGSLSDSRMIARRIAPCRTVICASPSYLERFGRPLSIDDLPAHNCLGYTLSRITGTERWPFGTKKGNGKTTVAVSGTLKANNGDALVAAAIGGLGLVYLPTFLVSQELLSGQLVALDLGLATVEFDGVFAVYPEDRRPPAKVRAAIDFLAGRFLPEPPWDLSLQKR